MAKRCFCPPLIATPRSPTGVWYLRQVSEARHVATYDGGTERWRFHACVQVIAIIAAPYLVTPAS